MSEAPPLRETILKTLIAALSVTALMGIYALLVGNFGHTETNILLTTLGISFFSVTSLGCAAAHEKLRMVILARIGLGVSLLGLILYVPGIWADWFHSQEYAKTVGVLAVASFSIAHVCLLSMANLDSRFRRVFRAAVASIFMLALLVCRLIIFEDSGERMMRIMGVVGILDGCTTLVIPILAKLSTPSTAPLEAGGYEMIELRCPSCGQQATLPLGRTNCPNCQLAIRVDLGE